jgi:hypothetical protein
MVFEQSSAPKKTYTAQCHCGTVKFTVDIPSLEKGDTKVNRCNCSICTKKGYWLVYPQRQDVVFTQGEDKMKEYFFAGKNKPHRFCGECGVSILIDFGRLDNEVMNKLLAVSVSAVF